MIEDIIVGFHGVAITLKIMVAFAGLRLIFFNLHLYMHPFQQTAKTLIKMALWASIPLLVVGETISRSLNLYFYIVGGYFHDPVSTTIIFIYLSLTTTGLIASLLWINFTAYGMHRGLRAWMTVIASAAIVGLLSACISYIT